MIFFFTKINAQPPNALSFSYARMHDFFIAIHHKLYFIINKKERTSFILCMLVAGIMGICNAEGQGTYYNTLSSGFNAYTSNGIKNDGTLWAWGENYAGQMGDGTTVNKSTPTQVGSSTNWGSISVGSSHNLSITANGKLWAWGDNTYGQLGIGTTVSNINPIQVGSATNWVSVCAGEGFSFAISADRKLWSWGRNNRGQLSDGTSNSRSSPVQVGTATNWISVSAGAAHTLAISADGKLWSCGDNYNNELGDGTATSRPSLTQIGTATNWLMVSAGYEQSFALSADGKLWGWGVNTYGLLGNGSTVNKTTPTQVGTATNWVSVSAGYYHTLGLTSDGKMWAWGYNSWGALGDGSTVSKSSPIQVGTATNWVTVSAGGFYSLGITADGQSWTWGNNNSGQLGDGTLTQSNSPQRVGSLSLINSLNNSTTSTSQQGKYSMYMNDCGFHIASISSTRASLSPITGQTTVKFWLDNSQASAYVKRHYEITPLSNAATVTGRPTLYFTQSDFDGFNAVNTVKLPTGSSDVSGIANLLIEKRSGVSYNGTGLPNTYPTGSTPVTINPADADIIWNATMSRWEVTFDVAGFSGFFVKSQTPALPMQMNSFSGTKVNGANRLVWNTKNEINTKQFLIEWSKDAANWNRLGIVAATGNNNNTYNYNHTNEPTGKIFYRLKMIDQDGQFTYSDLIWLNGSDNTSIIIYPNPVKSVVNLNIAKELLGTHVSLLTVDGKLLQSIIITSDQQAINVALLPSGIYMLTFADGTIEKFIKE